jgi:pantoate--beta-alanine ligase
VEIIRTVSWMKEFARKQRDENRIVGLVPTMGALHQGHLSLIKRARLQCSSVVASIFVNPTQFSPSEDFAKYPRNLPADTEKLENAGVQCLFLPEAKEIYPQNYSTYVNVDGLSERLEGRIRPGHFRGVSTVVMRPSFHA